MAKVKEKEEEKLGGSGAFAFNYAATKAGSSLGEGPLTQQGDVKAHHLLVLLLRLRQICNHPGLIRSMLDTEAKVNEGLIKDQADDLVSQMADMSIAKPQEPDEPDYERILDLGNPVFKEKRASSKIIIVMEKLAMLKNKQKESGNIEKAVIVSQWTSMLNIMKKHLVEIGFKVAEINGSIPVKERGGIVNDFNRVNAGKEVMLLSLGAGGVGLNLVGANHLFLLDMHR